MVKGISRQVIVVHSPDQKLFEQAIFILNDDAVTQGGITDDMLLKAADKLLHNSGCGKKRNFALYSSFWTLVGATAIGLVWLLTVLF